MYIVIDIIVLLILAGSVYRGYKKGIVDVGFKLFAFIISLLVAIILYSPITDLIIKNTEIDEKLEEIIIKNVTTSEENNEEQSNDTNNDLENYITKYSKDVVKDTKKSMIDIASKPLARNIIGISVIILLFLCSRIILIIIKTFTNVLTKLPVIKQLNEAGGIVYGLLAGLIVIYLLLVIAYFTTLISGNTTIIEIIENTYITKLLYSVF